MRNYSGSNLRYAVYTQASFGESAQRLSAGLATNYFEVAACCLYSG
ncbi:MAG: hypothetical protein ACLUKN_16025 [Bacilli bacterium]